jgi:hypothetical protein
LREKGSQVFQFVAVLAFVVCLVTNVGSLFVEPLLFVPLYFAPSVYADVLEQLLAVGSVVLYIPQCVASLPQFQVQILHGILGFATVAEHAHCHSIELFMQWQESCLEFCVCHSFCASHLYDDEGTEM